MTQTTTASASPTEAGLVLRQRMTGAYVFVAIAYLVLAASFIASTSVLMQEFAAADWPTLLVADSHLFLFYPTFGILALMAFYLPSVVFTHLYWSHLPYGRVRFLLGFAVALVLSVVVNATILGPGAFPRAMWEVAPQALLADKGEPANCLGTATGCRRGPPLGVAQEVRRVAQERIGVTKFARTCVPDPLVELPAGHDQKRWCAPSSTMLTAAECCVVQKRLATDVASLAAAPPTRSKLADLDQYLQAAKIFFVIVLLFVGGMLAFWRERIDSLYRPLAPRIERNVLIGGMAMLLWPIMDYAALDATNTMYGKWYDGIRFRLSLVIAPWVMLLLFYFLRRLRQNIEFVGQMAGVAVSGLAILLREEIKDFGVRFFGIGMDTNVLVVLGVLWVTGVILLFWPRVDRHLIGS